MAWPQAFFALHGRAADVVTSGIGPNDRVVVDDLPAPRRIHSIPRCRPASVTALPRLRRTDLGPDFIADPLSQFQDERDVTEDSLGGGPNRGALRCDPLGTGGA